MKITAKHVAIAALVVLGAAAGYALGPLRGQHPLSSCAANMAILDQKRQCGFADLGPVTVVGTVRRTKHHGDGDRSVDVIPDPAWAHVLAYKGKTRRDYIHCEFTPCDQYTEIVAVLDRVRVGDRVRITGRHAWDGVDHRGPWRDQAVKCLEGRGPDPELGWIEIHPAQSIELLSPRER